MCSASHNLTHLCSASHIITHLSKSDMNIVLHIDSSWNSSYQNTPLKPHMYHSMESCFGNIRGSNQIYSSAPRNFSIIPNTSLHQILHINICTFLIWFSPEIDDLIINSEGLSFVPTLSHLHSPFSISLQTKWYTIKLLFLLSVEYCRLVIITTYWLSQ